MDIVWIPCAVGGSLAAVIIVVTWFQNYLNTSAALAVVTVDGTELQFFWNALCRGLLHVEGIVHILVFLQSIYHRLLDGSVIQTEFLDSIGIEEYLIVHDGLHEVLVGIELSLQNLVQFFYQSLLVPYAGRDSLILQEGSVVHASMVGGEEGEIISLAHGLVEISEEISQSLIKSEIAVFCFYGVHAHLMTDVIGAGAADGQQISISVSTQVLACDGSLGNIEGQVAAERSVAENLVTMLFI